MILVADSGSTKCDWVLIGQDQRYKAETMGFNPFFHDADLITSKIKENHVLDIYKEQVKEIYFYGAGCSCPERNSVLKEALASHFNNLEKLIVDEDIAGAAYATCENEHGIVCILGTGSNSCNYDGVHVQKGQPALGYILGDEGSGSYFGKKLLTQFMYNKMPRELAIALQEYGGDKLDNLMVSIYNKPNANVFLASFMKFIFNYQEHPYFQKMIYDGMKHFAEIHVLHYENYSTTPVYFVGSVAHYFQDVLHTVAKDLGFTIKNIVQKPINALSEYHMTKVGNQV
ncbi:MAG: hypothetical protein JXR19_07725 [Bacteroidia bacterium]